MRTHAAYYRGYRIEGEKERQGWLLRISPERPELPILPRAELHTIEKFWPQAVADGVARIDALLPALKNVPWSSLVKPNGISAAPQRRRVASNIAKLPALLPRK